MTKVVKMTNREILENATKRLDKAGIAEAGNDAWLLFSEAFGMTRTDYLIDKNAPIINRMNPNNLITIDWSY